MQTIILTMSCLGFCAAVFTIAGAIELGLIYRESREKRERRKCWRKWLYNQRVIARIR